MHTTMKYKIKILLPLNLYVTVWFATDNDFFSSSVTMFLPFLIPSILLNIGQTVQKLKIKT